MGVTTYSKRTRFLRRKPPARPREEPISNPETRLTQKIRRALEERGAVVIKVSGGVENAGAPDLVVCHAGRFIALEVKTTHGRVSPLQAHTIRKIRRSGGVAAVVFDVASALNVIEE